MKVLTVRQPWAWAIIYGGKDVENRSWTTSYRGRLAIHSSQGLSKREYEAAREWILTVSNYVPSRNELEYGAIIGTVDLVDCAQDSDSSWFEGKVIQDGIPNYAWVLANPKPITPVAAKGRLGLWEFKI